MLGLTIQKTYANNFDKIYPLLKEFDSPYSKEDWQRIFDYQWEGRRDFIGYHLEKNSKAVGFMGLIFSTRNRNNQQYTFCNITSLIVKSEYRAATYLLIRKLKELDDVIFTGLNPIQESYKLLKMLNFNKLESHYLIIPTMLHLVLLKNKKNVKAHQQSKLMAASNRETIRIVNDHHLHCHSVLFECNGRQCLIVYRLTTQKHFKLPVYKIHIMYIENSAYFQQYLGAILKFFKKNMGAASALYVDKRFLNNKTILFSLTKKIEPPRIYKGNIHPIDVDHIYSEAILL